MKSKKTEKLTLSEFTKKFKKQHPELTPKQASKKAKMEYRKYIIDIKKKSKEDREIEREITKIERADMKD